MAFNSALHPHAPAGSPAGGQFAAGGGGQASTAKSGKKPAKGKTAAKKPAVKSPAFAQLKQWATMEHNGQGKKLTPAERQAVALAHKAHLAHVAHVKHVAAAGARAKPAMVKPKTAAKPKAAAKAMPKAAARKTAMPKTAGVASRF